MFEYPELVEFVAKHGKVTSFNFFIYGKLDSEEIKMLCDGLATALIFNEEMVEMLVLSTVVDEESAVAMNHYRGTVLTASFALAPDIEELVKMTILDGLEYLKFKSEYKGITSSENYV
jgi:hypothetical protein